MVEKSDVDSCLYAVYLLFHFRKVLKFYSLLLLLTYSIMCLDAVFILSKSILFGTI